VIHSTNAGNSEQATRIGKKAVLGTGQQKNIRHVTNNVVEGGRKKKQKNEGNKSF